MPNYGDPKYWDKRYAENDGCMFDWLEDYQSLQPLFKDLIPDKSSRIIIIGCGNAPLSEDMYDDGYKNILNVDISTVVIKQMQDRNKERREMRYEVMDCTDMSSLSDASFDIAIDKSTIDALLCGDNSYLMVAKMTREIQRILKPETGLYIAISYGKPESRGVHFERPHLSFALKQYILYPADITSEEQKEEKSHYIYVCRKLAGADEVCRENWDKVLVQMQREAEEEALAHMEKGSNGDDSSDEGQDWDENQLKERKKSKKGIKFRSHSR